MIYAKRYYFEDVPPAANTALLDAFVAHPEFLSYPLGPDQARAVGAHMLTDPNNLVWATYNKRDLTGVVILTRVVPKVDALLHFLFLDKDVVGKRKLLHNLLGHCFQDLGFHRLSMEIPEGRARKLEAFVRRVLGFRLEGEIRDRNPELPKALDNVWTARQGSRREQGYFDGERWSDIMLLRLLASEWVGRNRQCLSEPPQHPSSPLPPHPSSGPPSAAPLAEVGPVTPSPSSPKTSSPCGSPTSGCSTTS